MASSIRIYIAWNGDHVNRQVGRMAMRDDVEGLRRVSSAIEAGNDSWRSWIEAHNGAVITCGGDEGRAYMPGELLADLKQMRERYKEVVGASVSVGIGTELSEAEKALSVAKIRGGDRALIYTPTMNQEIAQSKQKDQPDDVMVKAEDLDFAALEKRIGDIPQGQETEQGHDYSHVLSPQHRADGYTLHVTPGIADSLTATLSHKGMEIGAAVGRMNGSAINVHGTDIDGARNKSGDYQHRGKGLGASMYTALMAHARHAHGAMTAEGGIHSTSASRTHASLARQHGVAYQPKKVGSNPVGDRDENYGAYSYALSEIPMTRSELVVELQTLLRAPQFDQELVSKLAKAEPLDLAEVLSKGLVDGLRTMIRPRGVRPDQATHVFGSQPATTGPTLPGSKKYDYSHLLMPEAQQKGMALHVVHYGSGRVSARVQHGGQTIYSAYGSLKGGHLHLEPGLTPSDHVRTAAISGMAVHARRSGAHSIVADPGTHEVARHAGLGWTSHPTSVDRKQHKPIDEFALAPQASRHTFDSGFFGGGDTPVPARRRTLPGPSGTVAEPNPTMTPSSKRFGKAEGEAAGRTQAKDAAAPTVGKPKAEASEHSQNEAIYSLLNQTHDNALPPPEMTHAAQDFEEQFHALAQQQADKDANDAGVKQKQVQSAKTQVAQILLEMRQQAPLLEQLRQQAPEIYQTMTRLTGAVMEMARQLDGGGPPMQKAEVMAKALAAIQPAKQTAPGVHDYSHLLSPEHRAAGYGLEVHHDPAVAHEQAAAKGAQNMRQGLLGRMFGPRQGRGQASASAGPRGKGTRIQSHPIYVALTHRGSEVGNLQGAVRGGALQIKDAEIPHVDHRGGKGVPMYSALMAHAKNHLSANYVHGGMHSTMAAKVHLKVAAQHGLGYAPQEVESPRTAPGPFDDRYRPYSYDLKAELPMTKAEWPAKLSDQEIEQYISRLHTGSRRDLRGMPWDAIYELRRVPLEALPQGQPPSKPDVRRYAGMPGEDAPPIVITRKGCPDGHHRIAAARLRGDTHHLAYVDTAVNLGEAVHPDPPPEPERLDRDAALEVVKKFDAAQRPAAAAPRKLQIPRLKSHSKLPMPHAPAHHHLDLPAGTVLEGTGRFKVLKPSGEEVWKQGRVGVIASREPASAGADYGHPTSSRNING